MNYTERLAIATMMEKAVDGRRRSLLQRGPDSPASEQGSEPATEWIAANRPNALSENRNPGFIGPKEQSLSWPTTEEARVLLGPAESNGKIRAAKLEAREALLEELSKFWELGLIDTKFLLAHDPIELIPAYEKYAHRQFDARAEQSLAHFLESSVNQPDQYVIHLVDVETVIIKDITPATYLLPDDPAVSDWKEIALTLKHGDYKTAQSVHETLAEPIGEWEIYLGRSFMRQVFRSKIEGSAKLLFDLKYRSHLRLFANRRAFDTRLRAYLGNRLAHWEAVACRHLADHPSAMRAANWRERFDAFQKLVFLETGERINREDIDRVAGYDDSTTRKNLGTPRQTPKAVATFADVLKLSPAEFLRINRGRLKRFTGESR